MRVGGKEGLVSDEWNDQADPGVVRGPCLIGYQVEATDGPIGRVDQHADEVRPAYIVVDTGPWIFGRRVLLPFGTVTKIDEREQKVYLDRSRRRSRMPRRSTRTSRPMPHPLGRSAALVGASRWGQAG